MSGFRWLACACAACVMLTAACRDRDPIVATVSVAAFPDRVPIGGALDVTLQFTMTQDAPPLPADGHVLLRLLFDDGEEMTRDDHDPPRRTDEWKPGTTIQYTRRVTVPDVPYVGDAYLAVGLAVGPHGRWLRLGAPKGSEKDRLYRLAKIVIVAR